VPMTALQRRSAAGRCVGMNWTKAARFAKYSIASSWHVFGRISQKRPATSAPQTYECEDIRSNAEAALHCSALFFSKDGATGCTQESASSWSTEAASLACKHTKRHMRSCAGKNKRVGKSNLKNKIAGLMDGPNNSNARSAVRDGKDNGGRKSSGWTRILRREPTWLYHLT